jgi:hypothetical protein
VVRVERVVAAALSAEAGALAKEEVLEVAGAAKSRNLK